MIQFVCALLLGLGGGGMDGPTGASIATDVVVEPVGLYGRATGWIEGRVVGEELSPIPGVRVEVSGGSLSTPLQGVTDREGRFRLGPLDAGSGYRLRAVHLGYHAELREELRLAAGETLEVELRLARQAVALDTIRAFGTPLRIRREDTEFATRIDARAIELLPTAHEPSQLVVLTPGARPGQIWGGADAQANLYQLDGIAQTHPGTGGAIVEPSMRWVERLEVRGLGAAAEHGGFQGGLVNVVTRSGSNLRRSGMRVGYEAHPLNASNLERREIGLETDLRREVEADASGPLVRDRLYYFVGGHWLEENQRAQGHLPQGEGHFLPWTRDRREARGFGKLRWEPSWRDRVDLSAGWFGSRVDNATLQGFETAEAAGALHGPTRFYTLQWDRLTGGGVLEVRFAGLATDERLSGGGGEGVPGARIFSHSHLPTPTYQNIPLSRNRETGSRVASIAWDFPLRSERLEHRIRIGGELSGGSFSDVISRSGGMTWRPVSSGSFDPASPSTWFGSGSVLPIDRGGTVDLHSRMSGTAIFIQDHITISPRLSISPGIRLGRWEGDLLPGGDAGRRFTALTATGVDPRLGVTLDPFGTNRVVLKGHWGRFHQGMLANFFDRVEGGEVYENRELWYYRGSPPGDPSQGFTDADFGDGSGPFLTREQVFRMNETGRVDPNYRHPHVDQWITGIEIAPSERIRTELLFVSRSNRNMVALVDRNLADNYHVYRNVLITGPDGAPIELDGEPFVLPEIHIPYDVLRRYMESALEMDSGIWPPGFVPSDLDWMAFEQDLVLTNPPAATRRFHQLQFAVHAAYPRWGASASGVWTRLRGNLNAVTSYEAGTSFEDFQEIGAGPFVRPNEQVNFFGSLPGFSPLELKLAVHGEVGWGVRAGGFLNFARGDRFTAYFPLWAPGTEYHTAEGQEIHQVFLSGVAGQRVRVQRRGSGNYDDRKSLDLRFDRTVPGTGDRMRATVDVFNVWNSRAITRIVNESSPGTTLFPTSRFGAVQERVPPRTLRIGITADF